MDISIVIPLLNEAESLPELHVWIKRVMDEHKLSYEVIFIDDGSSDESWSIIEQLKNSFSEVKGLKFRRNYGKSAALNEGFALAQGDSVFTMDADLQDSPDELPAMHKMLWEEGFDLVSGWKQKRYDPITKTLPTKLYNWATRRMSGIFLHDFNCGLKAYKNEVVKSIEVYGEMHRYIPVLVKQAGFRKIGEKVVQHQKRKFGQSKFGADRFIKGFLDLLTLWFLQRFGRRPMYFFGLIGSIMLIMGFSFAIYLGIDKLFVNPAGRLIAERPQFYVALTTMILGSQFFLAGFLGEIVIRNRNHKKRYKIKEHLPS